MKNIFLVTILLFVAGAILRKFSRKKRQSATTPPAFLSQQTKSDELPYRLRDDFLSNAEFRFFNYLKSASSEVAVICPKVSLQDIFFVSQGDKKTKFGLWQKINKKHVDFLLCSPETMKPIMGVELDDRSHQNSDRIERDDFVNNLFKTAKLPLLRFQVKKDYSEAEIKKAIHEALETVHPPQCPKCNIPLALKVNYKDQLFWGCGNYPKCKCTENYKEAH